MKRPNILWICADQQRWDTLGCYGNQWVNTPNLDELASGGALFERAYAQCPVCSPSRASFLTGRYPSTSGFRRNGQNLPENEVLFSKRLSDVGYVCGLSGKLHVSACHPSVCPGVEPRWDDGYASFHWSHHPMNGWGMRNEYRSWLEEQGIRYETKSRSDSLFVEDGMPSEFHHTKWCVDRAIEFIDRHAGGGAPWMYSLNLFDPHSPFDPPKEFLQPYLNKIDDIPLPDFEERELEGKMHYQREVHAKDIGRYEATYSSLSQDDHRLIRAAYWAMCDLLDKELGRLLESLSRHAIEEDTIVVFMSDHGEMLGDHGLYLKGPFLYEGAIRVPLIVSWPKKIRPGCYGELVELVDIAPSLFDMVGLKIPCDMDGRSFVDLISESQERYAPKKSVYSEYRNSGDWPGDEKPLLSMLRTDRYKAIVDHSTDRGELYDLKEDPSEILNRWEDPAYASMKSELVEKIAERYSNETPTEVPRIAPW